MKIITRPTVTVVAATQFFGHPTYAIPEDGVDAERLGAFAAKGCYDAFSPTGRANRENQRQVIQQAHGSVLEHASVSLFIEGITRGLSLEMNRHRHLSISQRSTRYVAEEAGAIVLDPYFASLYERNDLTEAETAVLDEHLWAQTKAIDAYERQVSLLTDLNPHQLDGFHLRKWARGKARNVLPHGLETRGTWTGNYRTWRHFITLRSGEGAEDEIRSLAAYVLLALRPLAPVYFEDFSLSIIRGIPSYAPTYGRV